MPVDARERLQQRDGGTFQGAPCHADRDTGKGATFDVLHHEEREAVHLPVLEQGHDAREAQQTQGGRLIAEDPLVIHPSHELDRHARLGQLVVRFVHVSGAATADAAADLEAVGHVLARQVRDRLVDR